MVFSVPWAPQGMQYNVERLDIKPVGGPSDDPSLHRTQCQPQPMLIKASTRCTFFSGNTFTVYFIYHH